MTNGIVGLLDLLRIRWAMPARPQTKDQMMKRIKHFIIIYVTYKVGNLYCGKSVKLIYFTISKILLYQLKKFFTNSVILAQFHNNIG